MPSRRKLPVALAVIASVALSVARFLLVQERAHRPVVTKTGCERALVVQERADIDGGRPTTRTSDPTRAACAGPDELTTGLLRAQALKTVADEMLNRLTPPASAPSPAHG